MVYHSSRGHRTIKEDAHTNNDNHIIREYVALLSTHPASSALRMNNMRVALASFVLLLVTVDSQCVARLPIAEDLRNSARIVAGLDAAVTDHDNIVTIAEQNDEGARDYFCVGSLISPEWVITAAQCFVRNENFVLHGGTSLTGTRYGIRNIVRHPGYFQVGQSVHRDDIQLIRLEQPVQDTIKRTPAPSPNSQPQPVPDTDAQSSGLPPVNPDYNFMYINSNTDFAMDEPRFLRLKGFGIVTQPEDATEPLRFRRRDLKFADLRTATCDDTFGNDGKRRLCTERDEKCGACYGDIGAPLYEVDKSGTSSVLVGIVTFGRQATSLDDDNIACTGDSPVVYTAVAHYASWIRDTIKEATGEERLFLFDLPKEGISDKDLEKGSSSLAIFATTSVIVISSLALLGTIVAVVVTCVVRHLRRKRKRWLEGLQAEDSFVKAGEKDAIIVDPFEGIQNDRQPRFSFTGFSRAAVKGATDFSSRSIGVLKAMVAREKDEDFFEPREPMEDAPGWLPGAWDKLFMPPSKKDLEKIHKVPTQRVVDDVLSGADKSVELSLEEVAYKSKREEANLEAAWAKLEIQTSLRNLSEAGESTANLASPALKSPTMSPLAASPRQASRNSSRPMSPLGSRMRKPGDLTKADTLLAAFASIDAESEQVAEETTIDSSALRALAEAKRPNVLAALRRKFSNGLNGLNTPSTRSNDREESDGEDVRAFGNVRGDIGTSIDSRGTGRLLSSVSRPASASSRNSRAVHVLSNASSVLTKGSLGSRHSSMVMDYFSEDYSVSNSSSDDDEHVPFEDMFDTNNRRYTEDRKPQTPHESRSILSSRSLRKSQNRSFERLERTDSSDSLPSSQNAVDFDGLSAPPRATAGSISKSTLPVDGEGHEDLPISTSTVSSDKRPRSSIGQSEAGPSSQTQASSQLILRNEERVSVHMEDDRVLPDRAVDYRTSRVPFTQVPSAPDSRAGRHREKSLPNTDNVSVHMEEEALHTDGVTSHGHRDHVQNLRLSGADTSKGRAQIVHNRPLQGNDDISSVHMEDATLDMTTVVRTAKTDPSADGPRTHVSRAQPSMPESTAKKENVADDRVSVYMEEDPSYEVRGEAGRKNIRAVGNHDLKVERRRPASERFTSTTPIFVDADLPSVHMEDETSAGSSVRARINAFDKSQKRIRPVSEPLPSQGSRESNMSVAKLKNMWNEIARRNSDDSN